MKGLRRPALERARCSRAIVEKAKKSPRRMPWALPETVLEWRDRQFLGGARSNSFRLLRGTIQLAKRVRANVPRGEFERRGLLTLGELALVLAAHEGAGDDHLVALAKPCSYVI
jgi:hypothetical protein